MKIYRRSGTPVFTAWQNAGKCSAVRLTAARWGTPWGRQFVVLNGKGTLETRDLEEYNVCPNHRSILDNEASQRSGQPVCRRRVSGGVGTNGYGVQYELQGKLLVTVSKTPIRSITTSMLTRSLPTLTRTTCVCRPPVFASTHPAPIWITAANWIWTAESGSWERLLTSEPMKLTVKTFPTSET
jgi:hypothetical protein